MMDNEAVQGGWVDTIKPKVNIFFEQIQNSRSALIEIALYGGVGFLSGFLLKKYSTYVALLVLFTVGLLILQQFEFIAITVHWTTIQNFFGLQLVTTQPHDNQFFTIVWNWTRSNMIPVVSYIVGFLFGIRIG